MTKEKMDQWGRSHWSWPPRYDAQGYGGIVWLPASAPTYGDGRAV